MAYIPCRIKSDSKRRPQAGFTVVELVLVLAILGLLATVVITRVGGIFGDSQEKTAQFHVNHTFKTPLFKYRVDMGGYPSTSEGLQSLIKPPSDRQHLWKGPYVDSIPDDPWNTPYQYVFPGVMNPGSYDLRSAGPDRQFNTADDIGNWKNNQ
jgi:general secretion pathway protein G